MRPCRQCGYIRCYCVKQEIQSNQKLYIQESKGKIVIQADSDGEVIFRGEMSAENFGLCIAGLGSQDIDIKHVGGNENG